MQPCEVCGGMGVDALGYCTQCRTFRGVPGQASGAPYSGAPYGGQTSGGPYQGGGHPGGGHPGGPTSGMPYGGYPTSPGPIYQAPTSAPPGAYQQPGYPYAAPPVAEKSRNSFTVPLIALSATLVVLVVAIVIVVVARGDDDPGPGTDPGKTQAAGKGLVDECVVGSWEVVDYAEDVATDYGKLKFVDSGKGATFKFGEDGKGSQDYGSGTEFVTTATIEGQSVKLTATLSGTTSFAFRTNDGGMTYSDVEANGKAVFTAAGQTLSEADLEGDTDPSNYTCDGSEMTLSTSRYRADMEKKA